MDLCSYPRALAVRAEAPPPGDFRSVAEFEGALRDHINQIQCSAETRDRIRDTVRTEMNQVKAGLDKRSRSFTQSAAGRR